MQQTHIHVFALLGRHAKQRTRACKAVSSLSLHLVGGPACEAHSHLYSIWSTKYPSAFPGCMVEAV